jgi:hypothetical protein
MFDLVTIFLTGVAATSFTLVVLDYVVMPKKKSKQ